MFVALGIQHAMRHTVICGLAPFTFSTLSHQRHDFEKGKKLLNTKCVLIFSTTFVFFVQRRTERDMIQNVYWSSGKVKVIPQQAEVAQGVPGRLKPRIFLTFGTKRVVDRQSYTPAAFTPRRNPWYSFPGAESTPGQIVLSGVATEKIPTDTTGDRSGDRPTSSAVP